MPVVSIIIPTHNRVSLLGEAVASVRAQTYADWELIVVDDGSTDGTRDYLTAIDDQSVRSVAIAHSANAARVRNAGAAVARGTWLAFLDADDLWLPDKLSLQLDALAEHPACRWSCTGVSFIDANRLPTPQRSRSAYQPRCGWILEALLSFDAAATMSTLMVEKQLFDDVGGFDEIFRFRQDYELALRLAARSEIHALAEPLTLMREHSGRTTSTHRASELYRYNEMVFRKAGVAARSKAIADLCARQRATQLRRRARALGREGDYLAAVAVGLRAIGVSLRRG